MADNVSVLRSILREDDTPYFSDDEIAFYLQRNKNDVGAAAYQMLIVKSESSQIPLPGITLPDSSAYFRRLAAQYRPNHSGTLGGR